MTAPRLSLIVALFSTLAAAPAARAQVLDKQKALDAQTFWDNRDFDWYKANVPFFDCPEPELVTTYYYRWELITKHLTYGSPTSGYSFTEFIDRPFWSGAYGAISCPAGHQIYEVRWLADPTYARDYTRYWFRTPGAQPRNYSTWLADSLWALHHVHPDKPYTTDLLPDLVKNFDGWAKRQWVEAAGLFWQNGHDDGMEFNINSRQTKDILRGERGLRPSFNSYMWADATAIARVADLAGDPATADAFRAKAAAIKRELQAKLWDPKREFFFPMAARDETDKEGNVVKASTLTYQSGKYAGSPHGRELHGYVPWQFNLPDKGFESAWRFLMKPDFFYADRGPTTLERNDPQFVLKKSCCWWSGQSWPFATTQTLKAMANLLQNYEQLHVNRADYAKLLQIYSLSHRKNGKPYLAEALHPDTGSFEGHDGYNHSEHYFHSGFCDLVITGLVGLKTRDDDTLELDPLAPADWDYFALDDLPYRGHRLSIVWDKTGAKYNRGVGLRVLAGGREIAASPALGKLTAKLPPAAAAPAKPARMNFAVNNDGDYFPRLAASFVAPKTSLSKLIDGNYWYHKDPPNRWAAAGSTNATDWVEIDLGTPRKIDTAKLYFLDDGDKVVAPARYEIERWDGVAWRPLAGAKRSPEQPLGHRPNTVTFPPTEIQKLRVLLTHAPAGQAGLTEIELWGDAVQPYAPAPPPAGNLAFNPKKDGFPKATASFSDRFGGTPDKAIDGKIVYLPTPMNRWTSYGSPDPTDWLEIDFGAETEVGRVVLHVYDDRGGVQPPSKYVIQTWTGADWRDAAGPACIPAVPTGSAANTVTFKATKTSRLRMVFTHNGKARSGVTEVEAWRE
ncbi:MAG TPA: discoidin domain-containing protein [Tepidisphaeraceae bacterium]|nr:discoidin domain-containing protein [Tepidisphaeraceae bacterium]